MNWFYDTHPPVKGFTTGQKITKVIYSKKSPFQTIRILETQSFGRILTLDNALQLTERDEFIYHEMLVHPILFSHPHPRRVLIIGGGDGGALREVLKHDVQEAFLVDIDEEVVQTSQKYLSNVHQGAFQDRRTRLIIADGYDFLSDTKYQNFFDVIIIDSTDPLPENSAWPLFGKSLIRKAYQALHNDGILTYQAGSLFFAYHGYFNIYRKIANVFPYAGIYWTTVPSFAGALWGFTYGSKTIDLKKIDQTSHLMLRFTRVKKSMRFYNMGIHQSSFCLPSFVRQITRGDTK